MPQACSLKIHAIFRMSKQRLINLNPNLNPNLNLNLNLNLN